MLTIKVLKTIPGKAGKGGDIGAYYARDDYYGMDATPIEGDADAAQRDVLGEGKDASRGVDRGGEGGAGGRGEGRGEGAEGTAGADLKEIENEKDPTVRQPGKGQWFGEGAERLELRGPVDTAVLNEILAGKLPNGEQLGKKGADGEIEHTAGWDLTFSAPKSVSVLAEITRSPELFKAHNDAVKEALTWLQDEASTTRKMKDGVLTQEITGKFVVAMFQHDTSRAQDPELHTHALLLNATEREDGKWRSLHSLPLYQHKMAAGVVYRAGLAMNLQALGLTVERTHADGRFEISSVPETVSKHFSKRREEIEAKLESWGAEGAEAAAEAAVRTRGRKANVDLPVVRGQWNEQALQRGFDAEKTLTEARARGDIRTPADDKERVAHLRNAIDKLSEREAAFSNASLIAETLASGMGRMTVAEAKTAIERQTGGGDRDLHRAQINEIKAWTTPKALQQEARYERQVEAGKSSMPAPVKGKTVDKALAKTTLNEGQREAVKLITTSRDQFVAVVGRPGTGKTYMLPVTKELLNKEGYTVIGLAPNGSAAKELQETGGLTGARTVASHLATVGAEIGRLKGLSTFERAIEQDRKAKEVWIVDEASQVNNRDMRKLVHYATLTGARVALIGDPAQLGSIEAGKPFDRLLDKKIAQVELDELQRQRQAPDRQLVREAVGGNISAAMNLLRPNIVTVGDEDARVAAMVDQWAASDNRDQTLMIAMRNEIKTRLNDGARAVLRGEGKLTDEHEARQLFPVFGDRASRKLALSYKAGDVIRFDTNYKALEIPARSYWHVIEVHGRDAVNQLVVSDGERTMTFNPRQHRNAVAHAQHFRPRDTTLAVNDKIVWNQPSKDKGLVNGDVLTVTGFDEGKTIAKTAEGREIRLDTSGQERDTGKGRDIEARSDQHWEHYYATSLYKSQGKTGNTVLLDAPMKDAGMIDHHAFLVGVSRHRDSLRFFTDQPAELEKAIINNPGDKTSAIETRDAAEVGNAHKMLHLIQRVFGNKGPTQEVAGEGKDAASGGRHDPELQRDPELAKRDHAQLPPSIAAMLNRDAAKEQRQELQRGPEI